MSAPPSTSYKIWVLGGFKDSDKMLDAGRKLRELGFTSVDAHTPFPLHGVDEALAIPRSKVPLIVFCAAMCGAFTGYMMQWGLNSWDFPINVGGRPIHSWPLNIPITFELGVLFSGLGAFLGTWALCGLPRHYHPMFECEGFKRASLDEFWISVELDVTATASRDDDRQTISKCLEGFGAHQVAVVEDRDT
jgi:hypothetical protein